MQLATKIYSDAGCRRDIVLLHGTGARAEMWRHQIPLLNELGFRCIVPDLRGHGESCDPGDKHDILAHMTDVNDTLKGIDLQTPAVFAGHSLGAIISMELASRQPELISKILAVSMPGKVPKITRHAFEWFLGWPYENMRKTGVHNHLGWRTRELVATDKRALEQVMENFTDLDYAENVPQVSCPVHFCVGRLDPVAPAMYVEQMHRSLPNSTCRVIDWAGHNCMDSQPKEFNRWLVEKLQD